MKKRKLKKFKRKKMMTSTDLKKNSKQSLISFEKVNKKYKSGVVAVNDMSVNIDEGELLYIIGTTGAGKTTLIKLLDGEEKLSSGTLNVNGFSLHKLKKWHLPKYRRHIGVVYQDFKLLPRKTVFENIAFACEVHRLKTKETLKRVEETIELVGLKGKERSYPQELSGGEQQRVAIARAIVTKPTLLIADEPTGNLDPQTSRAIMELLIKINENEQMTIIVVTHDENIVNEYRRRTLVLGQGVLVEDLRLGGYIDEKTV